MIYRIFFTIAGALNVFVGFRAIQVGKFHYRGFVVDLSDNKISLGIFFFVLAAAFLFLAFRGNHPEKYVICTSCTTPFRKSDLRDSKCPSCGGSVEDLGNFFDRNPQMKALHKKEEI